MSLALDTPLIERGDVDNQLEAWRITGTPTAANSDRGRLYVDVAPAGSDAVVSVFSVRARTAPELVMQGTAAPSKTVPIVLTEQNTSGLSGSVICLTNAARATVELTLVLALEDDLRRMDNRLRSFRLEEPAETDLGQILSDTMEDFILRISDLYHPPSRVAPALRSPIGSALLVEQGSAGLPEQVAFHLWHLNNEGDWELVGLQNPQDARRWAIFYGLALTWERQVRGSEDEVAKRADRYLSWSQLHWDRFNVLVDTNRDKLPEREITIGTTIIERA